MNQFKDVFLGIGNRDYKRAVNTQKCIRVSGKHNDLEEVGVDTYHHTFFEMLGNWSFGDYYKEEAIAWAWELLTEVWKLPIERLHATVFRTDDEAFDIWKKFLPESRIHRFDEKDNFWEMGETGPCGPCSEIHFDRTDDLSGGPMVNAGVPEVIEIWNLVFIQFNRKLDGSLEELTAKHVDTGMGFERIVAVMQNKSSNYDTDVFMPIIEKIEELSGMKYDPSLESQIGIAMRVMADHLRTLSFSIADGALPGNEGRGYVLRRILRRASRFARNLGFTQPILYRLLPALLHSMSETFPELQKNEKIISRVIKAEEESFLQTLERGLHQFDSIANDGLDKISGENAFLLYDTFGFPIDLTQLIARERGIEVDIDGFYSLMKLQKERSRAARKVHHQEVEIPVIGVKSMFTGYDKIQDEAEVLYVNENQVVFDKTPLYVESGGQVSDTGKFILSGETYYITDVVKSGDAIVHICDKNVEQLVGHKAIIQVDGARRRDIMRNHSATHLLHEALSRVLGAHIKQAGSLVAPDYLRFDFNHFEKVPEQDLRTIESIVNDRILEGIDVDIREMSIDDAKKNGKTKMFFGDKYGDVVRVVTMDSSYSSELCGGTHVKNTSDIGLFKIISESSIAAGVRRIEAITGKAVKVYLDSLSDQLKSKDINISSLREHIKQLEKELASLRNARLSGTLNEIAATAIDVDGVKLAFGKLDAESIAQLRDAGERLRNTLGRSGVGLLAAVIDAKVQLVCVSTDDIMVKIPAGGVVAEAARLVGGSGGGRPGLATAGGRDFTKIEYMFSELPGILKNLK